MALDPAVRFSSLCQHGFLLYLCRMGHGSLREVSLIRVNSSTKLSSRTNQHLRHVEKDILIPKIMREKAKERCSEQVQDFTKCCKNSGVLMVVKCRKENSAMKECLTAYYNDPAFHEECKMEYLKEREEFRKTGIPAKKRLQKVPTSM
nr:COX assembly mitochondrial protein homolog isoform X1 [Macaca fascicularis]